jgi:outer membrane receptor protein involved in Fe transport
MVARLALAAILALTPALFGQTQTATVRGTITDSSGAVLPKAQLVLTSIDQNRPYRTASNDAGEYVFLQGPPGHYKMTVEARGFKRFQRDEFTLEVAQVMGLDVQMQVGSTSEVIEVTGEAPLLEAESSALGEVVNSRTTEALPLNGRNVTQLVALTPGINTSPGFRNNMDSNGPTTTNGFSANGGRNESSTILVDGSPQEVMGYNQPAYVPDPDSVQEFKVQTNSLSAEYGRTGGAVVNVVSRAGTRQFHGALYEFVRNDAFDANGFFNNRAGRSKSAFRYNQFGGTAGGPMTPSREKTFFFFSYEGLRQVNPAANFFTVPTAAMKRGDFSQLPQAIYDPATIDAAGNRQPFAGKQIPLARQNAAAQKILGFYPDPNRSGIGNNFYSQSSSRPANNGYSIRIDHRFSDRHNLFGRVSWNRFGNQLANNYGNLASPNTGRDNRINRSVTVDDSYLLGGWMLHANLGYAYHSNPRYAPPDDITAASLGLPAKIDAVSQFHIFPRVEPSGYGAMGGDPTFIIGNKFETYTGTGDASKLTGRHTLKMGGTYRANKVSNFRGNAPAGYYTFNESWTRQMFNRAGGGDSVASMLLGLIGGGRIQYEPQLALTVPYYAVYAQDDWRVNDRLTLNLGLRWDADRGTTERFNRTSWFDLNAVFPVQAPGLGTLHGGLVFAGRDGRPRGNKDADNNNFAPRIGIAYKLTPHLVVRSGFGLFYNPTTGTGPNATNSGALSYNAVTPINTSIDGGRTPYATLSDPFPDGFQRPENGANGLLTFAGQAINANIRGDRSPYSAQWNFDVQYEVKSDMLLDVAYAGNAGVKLQANSDYNQLPDQFLALGDRLNDVVNNPFFGIFPATSSLGARTTTRGQLLRPFPQFTGVTHQWGTEAHSSYHALQTKFRKRYKGGLQMLAAYTWSKILDNYSSVAGFLGLQNPGFVNNNRKDLDKSLSALDIAHRLVMNFQYDLPLGKGRFLGNWSVNGIMNVQSGPPISIGSRQNTTNSFGGSQTPNSTGIPSATPGSKKDRVDNWFNSAAFVDAPAYTFGNVGRILPDNRGPYAHSWDLSILKNIPVRERVRFQLRWELFNAFNQVNFSNPSGTTFGRPEFGAITGTDPARVMQLGLKLYY